MFVVTAGVIVVVLRSGSFWAARVCVPFGVCLVVVSSAFVWGQCRSLLVLGCAATLPLRHHSPLLHPR